jgi:hypothetical protein
MKRKYNYCNAHKNKLILLIVCTEFAGYIYVANICSLASVISSVMTRLSVAVL